MQAIRIRAITGSAIFAAVTAIFSQISVPLPITPVPMNLGVLAVILTALLLERRESIASILTYIALGAVGIPVFAGFRGGPAVLWGPTGGYIFGYIACVLVVGMLKKSEEHMLHNIAVLVLGVLSCYSLGTAWFMMLTGNSLMAALAACVIPFLIGDIVKIAVAMLLYKKLAKLTKK